MLKQFLDAHKIDVDALARIKHRVFVVGRFNTRKGDDTDVYLFTNRRDVQDAYRPGCFTDIKSLNYSSFVDALRPAIAERIVEGDIPMIRQVIPTGDEEEESTSTIDDYNYFFWRASINTNQPAFQGNESAAVQDLLRDGEQQPGKGIFKIIRRNIAAFSSFQPVVPDVIESLSALLAICAREHGMPPYAAGAALPGGLPEKLVDFLFAENTQAPFTLDGLDFSMDPWNELLNADAAKSREMLVQVITAFRDALLEAKFDMFAGVRFRGKALGQQARGVLKPAIIKEFGKARDAFNGMRQILRSKVLLSMVLDWVFSAYYELDAVKAIPKTDEVGRDHMVRDIVLRDYADYGIAPALKRASKEERRKFSSTLSNNFEDLLVAIVDDGENAEKHLQKLPAEIRDLAAELRRDPDRRRLLRGISGTEFGGEYRKAFIAASQTILLDVLCPALYQSPVLSRNDLLRIFRRDVMTGYLTAVFLDDKHQDVVRGIAEEHLDYFLSNIDSDTKQIKNSAAVQQKMLRSYLDALAKPEVVRRLTEELEVLREMHTLLENVAVKHDQVGPGRISALRRADSGGHAFERTPVPDSKVQESVQGIAKQEIEREIALIEAAAAGAKGREVALAEGAAPAAALAGGSEVGRSAGAVAAAGSAAGPVGGGMAAAVTPASPDPEGDEDDNAITEAVRKEADKILQAAKPEERKRPEALAIKVTKQLLANPEFVKRAKNDISVFEKVLHLIYQRYVDNPDKKTFRNKVDRMTLVNMMLLFQKEIGIGKMCSNLHHMLIDMVEHIDAENPDAKAFIQMLSLTKYFDDAVLEGNGITNLRTTLDAQANTNLQNTVNFVSELRGIKYLFDTVKADTRAEVIVVNATAYEFVNWLTQDNLTAGNGRQRLLSGKLTFEDGRSKEAIPPGLVYLSDAAFEGDEQNKVAFLQGLSSWQLTNQNASLILPPLCVSTGHQSDNWESVGAQLKESAVKVPAPVIVVGPSPYLNRKGDVFQTYLPAGYVFAAHFLCQPEQRVNNENVIGRSRGRFRVIGSSVVSMRQSLEQAIWGDSTQQDSYAFAVDFYLYVVLMVLATARARGAAGMGTRGRDFWPSFYWTEKELAQHEWRDSKAIERALLGEATWFAMQQNLAKPPTHLIDGKEVMDETAGMTELSSVALLRPAANLVVKDVGWFNEARKKAALS